MNEKNIAARAFVVTGASTGIGKAVALELDRLGYRVFAGVRTEAAAEALRREASEQLTPVMLDVTVPESIAAAAKTIGDAVGDAGIAGLVNNAGIAVPGPLEMVPIEDFRRQFEVNVIGQLAVTQAMLPLLRKAKGRVVFMSSISGGLALPCMGAYAASKFAVEAICDVLRVELRNWGIRVSAVEPAAVVTPIWEKSLAASDRMAESDDPTIASLLPLYQADIDAIRKEVDRSIRTASPVERVVRAVVHALTSKRPKAHYYLGWNVFLGFTLLRLLPTGLRDWIVRKACGLK